MAPKLHLLSALLVSLVPAMQTAALGRNASRALGTSNYQLSSLASSALRPPRCPPCFNCMLPAFTCGQFGNCNVYDGQCQCPPGWAGQDCLTPQCDSLADGSNRRMRPEGEACSCKDGWGGINCNVCKADSACAAFPLAGQPSSDDGEVDPESMTCYKGGETVFNNHQMCNVTNVGIVDQLPGRPPQVTFSCDKNQSTCAFQFWVDQVESFYCGLEQCKSELRPGHEGSADTLAYDCEKLRCKCVPGRFLCGENGSIDLSDFLAEEIKGPATFSCKGRTGCRFEEPAMNELIESVFGDNYISLKCEGGECLHISQVPGYVRPPKPDNTQWVALSIAAAGLVVVGVCALLWYASRSNQGDYGTIRLPADESSRLMSDHVPAALHFRGISYTLPATAASAEKPILQGISGHVRPGEVLAIMGASGAGKSTFLDILARKRKRGAVGGIITVNGREVPDAAFRRVCGFVDQEDTLMRTLTVYETILYSALLRLPREMSLEAKKYRVMETMSELGILGIKDSRIGDATTRGISGGEKRRVSIACELVTSPSILFLDEPTSGLDAYNAYNVVESLASLAKNYKRTVVFTIHQPRSNIVSLFDQLLVLARGRVVYSGEASQCHDYLEKIGHPCPPGFNIADYLIDVSSQPASSRASTHSSDQGISSQGTTGDENLRDEERGLARQTSGLSGPSTGRGSSTANEEEGTELRPRRSSVSSAAGYVKRKTSQLLRAVGSGTNTPPEPETLNPVLVELVTAYERSEVAIGIKQDMANAEAAAAGGENGEMLDIAAENAVLKSRNRATWMTQFKILSGRTFKNLYRDPALLATHYISAFILALIAGFLFYHVRNDIGGFQNRLGFFFFTLAVFGFTCLSSLGLFQAERVLYMRERANGYYSSGTYFAAKVLFDIIPLRVVPPFVFGAIAYPLIGLVSVPVTYWKFMLILVLFNLATASVCLLLSVAFANIGVASFIGTLVMLFNLLFAGLLINRESVPSWLQWLLTISFFHAGFEGMAVNELRYLRLHEIKYGVELDVPAASILSTFGLRARSFWWPNIAILSTFFGVFTLASYLVLHFFVKERR